MRLLEDFRLILFEPQDFRDRGGRLDGQTGDAVIALGTHPALHLVALGQAALILPADEAGQRVLLAVQGHEGSALRRDRHTRDLVRVDVAAIDHLPGGFALRLPHEVDGLLDPQRARIDHAILAIRRGEQPAIRGQDAGFNAGGAQVKGTKIR